MGLIMKAKQEILDNLSPKARQRIRDSYSGNKTVDKVLKKEKAIIRNATSHPKVRHVRNLPWRI